MGKLIKKLINFITSPLNPLAYHLLILFISFFIGFCASHYFPGNKQAEIIEDYAEKLIEYETGYTIDFDYLDGKLSESF